MFRQAFTSTASVLKLALIIKSMLFPLEAFPHLVFIGCYLVPGAHWVLKAVVSKQVLV